MQKDRDLIENEQKLWTVCREGMTMALKHSRTCSI